MRIVSIDRVLETKVNGQIYEWKAPICQFYERIFVPNQQNRLC